MQRFLSSVCLTCSESDLENRQDAFSEWEAGQHSSELACCVAALTVLTVALHFVATVGQLIYLAVFNSDDPAVLAMYHADYVDEEEPEDAKTEAETAAQFTPDHGSAVIAQTRKAQTSAQRNRKKARVHEFDRQVNSARASSIREKRRLGGGYRREDRRVGAADGPDAGAARHQYAAQVMANANAIHKEEEPDTGTAAPAPQMDESGERVLSKVFPKHRLSFLSRQAQALKNSYSRFATTTEVGHHVHKNAYHREQFGQRKRLQHTKSIRLPRVSRPVAAMAQLDRFVGHGAGAAAADAAAAEVNSAAMPGESTTTDDTTDDSSAAAHAEVPAATPASVAVGACASP